MRREKSDKITLSSYEKDFELTYTHNSTAIEGNTLTLMETKVIIGLFADMIADLDEVQLDEYIRLIKA